ncbi:MAG: hypothetical protein ACT4OJ_04030, partial [Bacteroidota bacterium]
MKKLLPLILLLFITPVINAQLLNKVKQKAQDATSKPSNKTATNGSSQETGTDPNATTEKKNTSSGQNKTQDQSTGEESDFIPGSTVLYYDNFEKEKTGDLPAGWITSSSAEVSAVEGLKGKWLKLFPVSSLHLTRSKKQSWGTQFTIEFDLVMTKVDYDPRISFVLINTKGNLVTDQNILRNKYYAAYVSTILGEGGRKTRLSLYKNDNINNPVSDAMSEQ